MSFLRNIQTKRGKHPVSMYVTQYGGLAAIIPPRGPNMELNELARGIHVLDREKIPTDASKFDREEYVGRRFNQSLFRIQS